MVRQGAPLSTKPPQTKAVYGARTQAALLANIEKTRFRGNAPVRISPYLERPTSKGTATQPDKDRHGRLPDLRAVEPTTKEERLEQAAASPRHAHQDITEHETWRDLMEESPRPRQIGPGLSTLRPWTHHRPRVRPTVSTSRVGGSRPVQPCYGIGRPSTPGGLTGSSCSHARADDPRREPNLPIFPNAAIPTERTSLADKAGVPRRSGSGGSNL